MELRIPSVEQLRTIYDRDLKEAFPTAELKPLRNIEQSWAEGWYKPYCLFDGDNIVGEAFLCPAAVGVLCPVRPADRRV